jgi:hypothetical protein
MFLKSIEQDRSVLSDKILRFKCLMFALHKVQNNKSPYNDGEPQEEHKQVPALVTNTLDGERYYE